MSKDQPSGNVDAVFNQIPNQGINLGTPKGRPSTNSQNGMAESGLDTGNLRKRV